MSANFAKIGRRAAVTDLFIISMTKLCTDQFETSPSPPPPPGIPRAIDSKTYSLGGVSDVLNVCCGRKFDRDGKI